MSQTCHCCNQLSGDCNFDFCSPWVFSMVGPQPSNQQPFYTDKYYSIRTEFDFNSFIWNLSPDLSCDDPLYDNGRASNYNNNIQLMTSKVFYIDPKSNIDVQFMMENTAVNNMSYKIQIKPLLKQCFYCRQCCSDSGSGICFNIPISIECREMCDALYDNKGIKTILPSTTYDGPSNRKDCSKKYVYSENIKFNTESYGPFWLVTIYIEGETNDYYGPKLGFKNTGAFSINGIKNPFCSRFSRLMITSQHDVYSDSEDSYLACFTDSFFSDGENDIPFIRGPRLLSFGNRLEIQNCNYNEGDFYFCHDVRSAAGGPIMAINGSYATAGFWGWHSYYSGLCYPMIYNIFD